MYVLYATSTMSYSLIHNFRANYLVCMYMYTVAILVGV